MVAQYLPPPDPTMMAMPPPMPTPPMPMASPLSLVPDGIMQPSPLMGDMGMQDPMAMLSDPSVLIALLDLMAKEGELQNGPVYPRWYKPGHYPKPKLGDVMSKARQDKNLHQLFIRRVDEDRRILALAVVGQFKDADKDVEVTFQDASLVHDTQLVVNLVAGCDTNYESRARKMGERAIAEKKEQFAHAFREKQIRRHARMYGTSLQFDEVKTAAQTGRYVSRLSLDFDAESSDVPIKMDLLEPTTCFPTWGGDRGLESMTRIYSESISRLIGCYDEDGTNKVRTKLTSKQVSDQRGGMRYLTEDDQVEVMEYWDRRWYCIVANSEMLVCAEHKFGRVPFVYLISSIGDTGPQTRHSTYGFAATSSSTAQQDVASKGLSHIAYTKKTLEQREAIFGRMLTELKKTANPDRTFEQDISVYGQTPMVTNAEGGISLLRMGMERELPPTAKPGFSLAPPILGAINEAVSRGMMPTSAYGLTQNANESGTAIEGLNESGRDKITPWMTMLQDADRENAELALELTRDWGHLLGSEGQRGTFEIERHKMAADQEPTVTLEPAELRQVGCTIRAKRTSLRLSNIGALGNALTALKNNGWLEDERAMEMLGVQDPTAALRRIQIQEFKKSEEYQKVMLAKWMREDEGLVYEAGIVEDLIQKMNQPPAAPPMALPGGPGVNGGAPMGGMAPQGADPMQGAMGMPEQMGGPLPGPPPGPGGIM